MGGYAAMFGKKSHSLGSFSEIIEPQAFAKSQSDGWDGALCRYEHDSRMLMGSITGGTLHLRTDATGLDYAVDLPPSRQDVYELIERRDVRSSSFAFQAYDQDWTYDDGQALRHLVSVRLIDVAPGSTPAYPDATVALRSLAIQFDIPDADVFALHRDKELRKRFTRSDKRGCPATTLSGRQALEQLMAMTSPVAARHFTRPPAQARAELTRIRYPHPRSPTPKLASN